MEGLSKSAPWVTYARKLKAIFGSDPEITINYIEEPEPEVKLLVNNPTKADALSKILPTTKAFGNVTIKVTVVPSNANETFEDLIKRAFAGNPIVSYIDHGDGPFGSNICFVAFENDVIQYFDDRLDDPYGLDSTLAEDICREIFENAEEFGTSVRFCTDLPVVTNLNDAPLGEWP